MITTTTTQIDITFTLPEGSPDCCCGEPEEQCSCNNLGDTLYGRVTLYAYGLTVNYETFILNKSSTDPPDIPCSIYEAGVPIIDANYYSDTVHHLEPHPPGIYPADFCRIYLSCGKVSETLTRWGAYGYANDHIRWQYLYEGCNATLPMLGWDGFHLYILEISDTPF